MASPVASEIFFTAESRLRSRLGGAAGSWMVMVPRGPVTRIRPLPARSAWPPASRMAATRARAAGLRQRSGTLGRPRSRYNHLPGFSEWQPGVFGYMAGILVTYPVERLLIRHARRGTG